MSDELKELERRLNEDIKNNEPSLDDDYLEWRSEGIIDGIKVALYEIAHLNDEYHGRRYQR
ncbi:MAG: hypothetical protein L0I00_08105 [Lactiplantibacillus plantarum]|nr:hypothetical protein [Lactiplantibacillus plantarum]MDN5951379.1 hypothetical protein [Loigolactobacillus coryniformis]